MITKSKNRLHRIAISVPGGVGDEASGIHIPSVVQFIARLSDHFSLTVYPLISPSSEPADYRCGNAVVRNLHLKQSDHVLSQMSALTKEILRDYRQAPFEIIHGFWALPTGFAAVILGKFLHCASVVSVLGGETANLPQIGYGNMQSSLAKRLTLWTCRRADALIALTHFQAEGLQRYGIGRGDIHIIPPSVDTSVFRQNGKAFPHTPLRCLHVANVNAVKDQSTLLKAFALVAEKIDCRLRIAGRDYMSGEIQALAKKLEVSERTEFLGFQTQQQLLEHYGWADLLLHTSLHEGGGVVIAEAAASGVVVCGTNVGLLSDLGRDRAIVVDVGDYESLARGVFSLVDAPDRYTKLREGAYQWSQTHNLDRAIEQLSMVYNQLHLG
ncbi:MAG: glycosyltransferase [Ignavibacteriae bacterium]|nr:glycosyltransferase [Ignavibacteria bacterium]MBI3363665.1 glycosyltransferase [Ignavibacteriota bacterium]